MPGQFNPDKNLFSVAPVGQIIIIGRSTSLRGGLSREYALNLATWLLISANATPAEVKAGIQDAMTGSALNLGQTHKAVVGTRRTVPQPPPPAAVPANAVPVSAEVAGQVTPFIGQIDPEEAEGIAAAIPPETAKRLPQPTAGSPVATTIKVVDPNALADLWKGEDDNG